MTLPFTASNFNNFHNQHAGRDDKIPTADDTPICCVGDYRGCGSWSKGGIRQVIRLTIVTDVTPFPDWTRRTFSNANITANEERLRDRACGITAVAALVKRR